MMKFFKYSCMQRILYESFPFAFLMWLVVELQKELGSTGFPKLEFKYVY